MTKEVIGANATILDYNVWGNVTFDDLARDTQKALDVLLKQPEVDPSKVVLIGHSEVLLCVPRIAINYSDKVGAIVLMGTLAQNLKEIGHDQVIIPVLYAQQVLDHDHNGLISVKEASEDPVFKSLVWKPYLSSCSISSIGKWNRRNGRTTGSPI